MGRAADTIGEEATAFWEQLSASPTNLSYLDSVPKSQKVQIAAQVEATLRAGDPNAAFKIFLSLTGKTQAILLGGGDRCPKLPASTVPVIESLPVFKITKDVWCQSLSPTTPGYIAHLASQTPWFTPTEASSASSAVDAES